VTRAHGSQSRGTPRIGGSHAHAASATWACHTQGGGLEVDDGGLLLDLDEGDEFSLVGSGAAFGHFGPGFGGFEVRIPEGPSSALAGTEVVEGAVPLFGIEEDAIVVGLFAESAAGADLAGVDLLEFVEGDFEEVGDGLHLFLVDPDIAGGTGAAVAALGAGKTESILVPGFSFGFGAHRVRPGWKGAGIVGSILRDGVVVVQRKREGGWAA